MKRVLIVGRIHEEGLRLLANRGDIAVEELDGASEAATAGAARGADAILIRTSRLSARAIEGAGRLKIVSRHGVGIDNVDLDALNARRIPLTIIGPVNAVSVAEHTLYLLLAATKRGLAFDRAVRAGDWSFRDGFPAVELSGKTLLIVGFGRIGREVAPRARAFGMRVIAYDPYGAPAEAGVGRADDLDAALGQADAVSLHVPLTSETRNLFDAARLARMKPSAVLVSTARGGLIDEAALADALASGRLAAAGLDVFAEEPPPASHKLLSLDNAVLSPHAASLTQDCAIRMAVISARNCLDGLDGRLDRSLVVNPQVLGDPS